MDRKLQIATQCLPDSGRSNLDTGAIFERLHGLYCTRKDIDLARLMGVLHNTMHSWKKRGSIPFEYLIDAAVRHGILLDYIVFGSPEIAQDYCATVTGRIDETLFLECWQAACRLTQSRGIVPRLTLRTYNARVTPDDWMRELSTVQIAAVIYSAQGSWR